MKLVAVIQDFQNDFLKTTCWVSSVMVSIDSVLFIENYTCWLCSSRGGSDKRKGQELDIKKVFLVFHCGFLTKLRTKSLPSSLNRQHKT